MSIDVVTLAASKNYTDKQIEKASIKGVDLSGYVQTVNGVEPDASGNVQIAVSGGSGVAVSGMEPAEDDIPKVFLTGSDFGNMTNAKNEVNMEMEYRSKTKQFHAYILIKFQGNSSLTKPKKNFTVKLYSDEARASKKNMAFKDWEYETNKYVLKANFIDHTHARNIVGANLWSEVVASRSDYDSLPEELRNSPRNGAVDGFPIKLYVNGTYQGVYTWNIGKDAWMWGMDEDNPNHVLLCNDDNSEGYEETAANFRKVWGGYDGYHYAIEVGTNSTALKTSLNNLITFVMNNNGTAFKSGIGNYLDVQSAIDYYIHMYVICGLDGLAQNMLLGTYDGTLWRCGAYDMDSTFGLWWTGSKYVSASYKCPEDYQEKFSLLWERLEENYWAEIKARYAELRKTVYSASNMFTVCERFTDVIGSDLYSEDLEVYPTIPQGDTNNIKQLRNYIRDRLAYCDNEITNGVPGTSITLSQATLSLNTEAVTLTATVLPSNTTDDVLWLTSNPSVATVVNGVVTPVADGSCTIRAKCGSGWAVCEVTANTTPVEPETPAYTNQVPISIDTDGSVYNGTGYMNDYRLSSSGAIKEWEGSTVSGFIPAKPGDVIRIVGVHWYHHNNNYICAYDSSFTYLGHAYNNFNSGSKAIINTSKCSVLNDDDVLLTLGTSADASGVADQIAYIRVSSYGTSETIAAGEVQTGDKMIVTVNEEIT